MYSGDIAAPSNRLGRTRRAQFNGERGRYASSGSSVKERPPPLNAGTQSLRARVRLAGASLPSVRLAPTRHAVDRAAGPLVARSHTTRRLWVPAFNGVPSVNSPRTNRRHQPGPRAATLSRRPGKPSRRIGERIEDRNSTTGERVRTVDRDFVRGFKHVPADTAPLRSVAPASGGGPHPGPRGLRQPRQQRLHHP